MEPGEVLANRFVIERLAGAGGMGTVYRALDRAQDAPVALKLLTEPDPRGDARFAHEARILAELEHPGIVRFIAHGVTAVGQRWLAMEWLEGEDRSAKQSARAGSEALRIAKQSAPAGSEPLRSASQRVVARLWSRALNVA